MAIATFLRQIVVVGNNNNNNNLNKRTVYSIQAYSIAQQSYKAVAIVTQSQSQSLP